MTYVIDMKPLTKDRGHTRWAGVPAGHTPVPPAQPEPLVYGL